MRNRYTRLTRISRILKLNYDKKRQFGCELYAKHKTGKMNDNDPTNGAAESGLVERFRYANSSKIFTLKGVSTPLLKTGVSLTESSGYSYLVSEQTRVRIARGRYL